jgi:hypothetical protein
MEAEKFSEISHKNLRRIFYDTPFSGPTFDFGNKFRRNM